MHRANLNSFYSPSCSDSVSVQVEEETEAGEIVPWRALFHLLCLKPGHFVPAGGSRVGEGESWDLSIKSKEWCKKQGPFRHTHIHTPFCLAFLPHWPRSLAEFWKSDTLGSHLAIVPGKDTVHWYPRRQRHPTLPRVITSYLLAPGKHFLLEEEANPLTYGFGGVFVEQNS